MDTIGAAYAWVIANWATVGVAALAVSGAFAQVAQLTPWGWDDEAAGVLGKLLAFVSGNLGTAKGK